MYYQFDTVYDTLKTLLVLFEIVENVTLPSMVPAVAADVLKSPTSPHVPVHWFVARDISARQLGGFEVKFVVVYVPIVNRPTVAVISEPRAVSLVAGAVVLVPTAIALMLFVWFEKLPIFSSTQRLPAVTIVLSIFLYATTFPSSG